MTTLQKLFQKESFISQEMAQKWNFGKPMSKKEENGLAIIVSHPGKRRVFESYLQKNHQMAMKYLWFISRNPHVHYIRWDIIKEKFVTAS